VPAAVEIAAQTCSKTVSWSSVNFRNNETAPAEIRSSGFPLELFWLSIALA
jgi:hypothetical protein